MKEVIFPMPEDRSIFFIVSAWVLKIIAIGSTLTMLVLILTRQLSNSDMVLGIPFFFVVISFLLLLSTSVQDSMIIKEDLIWVSPNKIITLYKFLYPIRKRRDSDWVILKPSELKKIKVERRYTICKFYLKSGTFYTFKDQKTFRTHYSIFIKEIKRICKQEGIPLEIIPINHKPTLEDLMTK